MKLHIDLRIAELLASRLCHDLVSPVGAVNNGMELLEDDLDPDMIGDAVALASGSARQASAILQFYRLAYGLAGQGAGSDPAQFAQLAEGFVGAHKSTLVWRADGLASAPNGGGKLLLNMIALGVEALPRGGELSAAVESGARPRLSVTATGRDAGLRAECKAALADEVDSAELTPRSVQGHLTWLLARRIGGTLDVETPAADKVVLSVPLVSAATS